MQHEASLRAVTNRLTTTPVQDLPRIVGFLASSLAQCPLESQFSDPKGVSHKLKTRVTALLQDRSVHGRLSAAVIIKVLIDHGSPNVLASSDVWARGLLSCLGKPDPVEVKRLYLATVTRIFVLTQDHAALLREITTPLIAPFLNTCLGLIKPVSVKVNNESTAVPHPLLESVLQVWTHLLPQHATVFRPFLTRIRLVCQSIIGNSDSSISAKNLAIKLLCLLLSSAPKNVLSQEWAQNASSIINSAHQTADKVFRAVVEEYEPNDSARQRAPGKQDFSSQPKMADDILGLGPWNGIHEGGCRLAVLVAWLEGLVSTSTLQPVAVPVGAILDLTSRILAVVVPANNSKAGDGLRLHKEASRDEKEELWMSLPRLHIACLRLLHRMHATYGQSLIAIQQVVASQILDLFEAMSWHDSIRQEVYHIFCDLLRTPGIQYSALKSTAIKNLVEGCCQDLKNGVPSLDTPSKADVSKGGQIGSKQPRNTVLRSEVFQAAWELLPEIFAHCPASVILRQSRIEMDRLSVILDHRDAMIASVMRPMFSEKKKASAPSLLPFLARSAPDTLAVETLLRPRIPVTRTAEISHPQSRDTLLGSEDMDEDPQDGEGDLLSQLENSLNDIHNDSEEGGEDLDHTDALGNPGDEPGKKRPFDELEPGFVQQANVQASEEVASRQAKIPRLEDESTDESPSMTAAIVAERNIGNEEVVVAQTSVGTFAVAKQPVAEQSSIPGTAPRPIAQEAENEDSDGSDFEIPTIDPGLDTDEED